MSLNQLLDQFLNPQGAGQNTQDPNATGAQQGGGGISQALGGLTDKIPGGMGGMAGGLAAGGLLGLLVGNKKARKTVGKMATGAAGIAGGAALGALAFKAFQSWQGGGGQAAPGQAQPAAQAPSVTPQEAERLQRPSPVPQIGKSSPEAIPAAFVPAENKAQDGQPFELTLVKAMIAAANADGHIDAQEQKAIFDAVGRMELESADKAVVFDTLSNPPSLSEIAASANGLEQASEIYLVSRLAIDPDDPSERRYLVELSEQLKLPDGLAAHLDEQVANQTG